MNTRGEGDRDRLAIGRVRKPHGVKGLLRVQSYSGELAHFERLQTILLCKGTRSREFRVESVSGMGKDVLMKVAGVESPEQGKELAGWEVVVDRQAAAPLAEGEYYLGDLCSCVVEKDDRALGRIFAVCEGGSADLLEIEVPSGKRYFVPFMEEFIGKVDVERGIVELKADWLLS